MFSKAALCRLAEQRLAEAQNLLTGGFWSGAYYLSGYSAELGLKAVVATRFVANAIPDRKLVNAVYTHNIAELVEHAGLRLELDGALQGDSDFADNWEIVKDWKEDARYQEWSQARADLIVMALSEPKSGVFTWIRAHW